MTATTLFERLGGTSAISDAAPRFTERVVADDLARTFFDDDDDVENAAAFLIWAFGGPSDFELPHQVVKARGIGDAHFDAVVRHVAGTLEEMKVEEQLINEAVGTVLRLRGDILPQ